MKENPNPLEGIKVRRILDGKRGEIVGTKVVIFENKEHEIESVLFEGEEKPIGINSEWLEITGGIAWG